MSHRCSNKCGDSGSVAAAMGVVALAVMFTVTGMVALCVIMVTIKMVVVVVSLMVVM